MWTTLRLAHIPTGEQNQKKRTFDVLPKPDNFIRYRQHLPPDSICRPTVFIGFGTNPVPSR
jgi:hypothetical protein